MQRSAFPTGPDPTALTSRSNPAIPSLHPDQLSRPRLLRALEAGMWRPITLVVAPAGSGKSSLLAEWCHTASPARPIAWLSLDEQHNDTVAFWTAFITALRQVYPDRFSHSLTALSQPGVSLGHVVLPSLLNELRETGQDLWLIVDDVQVMTNPGCIASFRSFIDRLTPTLHLVLAARSDPPIGLTRLRGGGHLAELRAANLRFTSEEVTAFLNGTLGLDLTPDELSLLTERMEGWAAGLYLAALVLRDRSDRHDLISRFDGQLHDLVASLGRGVLARLPEADRTFLVETAMLEELTAPLCDAVLGRSDSTERLRRLTQQNLLLVAQDDRGQRYRYHQLFRDLLLAELAQRSRDDIATLHRRAAAWYHSAGEPAPAIHHALAAGDYALAGEYLLAHGQPLFAQGYLLSLARWLDALPEAVLASRPALAIATAWVAGLIGRAPAEVERLVAIAAAGTDGGPFALGEPSLAAAIAFVRGLFVVDDVGAALANAQTAAALITDPTTPGYLLARHALGSALYLAGRFEEALAPLEAAARAPLTERQAQGLSWVLARTAQVYLQLGDEDRGGTLARRAVRLIHPSHIATLPNNWLTWVAAGITLTQRGRLVEAEAVLAQGVEPHLMWLRAWPVNYALALLALVPVRHRRGHQLAARSLLKEARVALRGCRDAGMLPQLLAETERFLEQAAPRHTGLREELSEGELRVLRLLASDLTQREIGRELYLSVNTVKSHVRGIYTKLDAASRQEAVQRAQALGVIA